MSESVWLPVLSPETTANMLQQRIMNAAANAEPQNEHAVLDVLAQLVLTKSAIQADFQALANAVIAKAFLTGALPASRAKNRPKGSGRFAVGASQYSAEDVAVEFFDALDTCEDLGEPASKAEVVAWLAERHAADEKTIERALKDAEPWLPDCKDARDQSRNEGDLLGRPWDYRNRDFAAQVKAGRDAPPMVAGVSLDDAIRMVQRQIDRAHEGTMDKN